VSASSRDEALRLAGAFARNHQVDVWYGEEGAFCPVESFRRSAGSNLENMGTDTGQRQADGQHAQPKL
jgi:hypothetical protein